MQWPWDFPSVRHVKQPHTCPEWPSEDIRVVPSQVAEGGGDSGGIVVATSRNILRGLHKRTFFPIASNLASEEVSNSSVSLYGALADCFHYY